MRVWVQGPLSPPLPNCPHHPANGQLVGAILGSAFLYTTVPHAAQSALGSNSIQPGVSVGNAMTGEILLTFVLVRTAGGGGGGSGWPAWDAQLPNRLGSPRVSTGLGCHGQPDAGAIRKHSGAWGLGTRRTAVPVS